MHTSPGVGEWSDWGHARYRLEVLDDCAIVTAVGEVDKHTAVGLGNAVKLGLRSCPHLILDMTSVTFIDSTGLGALVSARRQAYEVGGNLSLVSPPAAVCRILGRTQLERSFPIYPSLGQALTSARTSH